MIETLSAATIGWIVCGILAACVASLIWIVFYVTRAPIMELHCPKCGIVDRHDKDGNCERCGLPVELFDRGQR